MKKSATKPEENNRTMPRRTIFAVKPIRRQRDHPVVAAAGDELYQQNNYSYQISDPVTPTDLLQVYNTAHTPSHLSSLVPSYSYHQQNVEIINSLKSDFHQQGSV